MNAVDRVFAAALQAAARRLTEVPDGPLTERQTCAALSEFGRGVAAVVDVLDGRPCDYVPGPALAWLAQGAGGRSLLGNVARVLGDAFDGGSAAYAKPPD